MKPEAQPPHRQDSQPDKDALGRTAPKGRTADSASPHEGFTDSFPYAGQVNLPMTGENASAALCGAGMDTWCGSSIERPDVVSVTILRNAMDENRQRRGRHAFAQPAAASYGVCTAPWPLRWGAGLADPAQAGSAGYRGAKHRAAGMGLVPIPWRQAKHAAPQVRRREGLKPNGRDSEVGTGRSPKARRRGAPTRPGWSIF